MLSVRRLPARPHPLRRRRRRLRSRTRKIVLKVGWRNIRIHEGRHMSTIVSREFVDVLDTVFHQTPKVVISPVTKLFRFDDETIAKLPIVRVLSTHRLDEI
jgi:hypothetical protein